MGILSEEANRILTVWGIKNNYIWSLVDPVRADTIRLRVDSGSKITLWTITIRDADNAVQLQKILDDINSSIRASVGNAHKVTIKTNDSELVSIIPENHIIEERPIGDVSFIKLEDVSGVISYVRIDSILCLRFEPIS